MTVQFKTVEVEAKVSAHFTKQQQLEVTFNILRDKDNEGEYTEYRADLQTFTSSQMKLYCPILKTNIWAKSF